MNFAEFGFLGLFSASFLSATFLPFGSTPFLLFLLAKQENPLSILVVASVGNTLGGMASYGLGHLGKLYWLEKFFKISHKDILKWQKLVERFGAWGAFFSWLPFVGDPLCAALGFFRVPWKRVCCFMFVGKALRYLMVIMAFHIFRLLILSPRKP